MRPHVSDRAVAAVVEAVTEAAWTAKDVQAYTGYSARTTHRALLEALERGLLTRARDRRVSRALSFRSGGRAYIWSPA